MSCRRYNTPFQEKQLEIDDLSVNESLSWVDIDTLNIDMSIGVYDWEKETLQRVELSLNLACNMELAGKSDQLQYAIDYAAVTELRLSGLVSQEDNHLSIASPLYQDMFDRQWLLNLFNHYQTQSPPPYAAVKTG